MTDAAKQTASILIVDDDPTSIRVLGRLLATLGQVRFAMEGQAALALMHASRPDVVLLDAEMPGLSGVNLCRLIKRDPALADVPVIVVTGNGEPSDVLSADSHCLRGVRVLVVDDSDINLGDLTRDVQFGELTNLLTCRRIEALDFVRGDVASARGSFRA